MALKTAFFRSKQSGAVVERSAAYARKTHPFYDLYEYIGDEYEDDKVTIAVTGDGAPAKNASRDEWAEYQALRGHDVTEDMTRTDLIALDEGATTTDKE